MGFPRQEYWSGLPFPLPGHLPAPGIKPPSPALQADDLQSEPPGKILLKSENEVAQSCPTLCDPVDCRPSGSSVYGILQARILEWVAIALSRERHYFADKGPYSQSYDFLPEGKIEKGTMGKAERNLNAVRLLCTIL